MKIQEKLQRWLSETGVPYRVIEHRRAATARATACAEHVPFHEHAKVIAVKLDGRAAMVMVPADAWLDVEKLKYMADAKKARVLFEEEVEDLFPGCECGAMPPVGEFFNLPLYADASLVDNEWICFNAGTHKEAIQMRWGDFVRLAKPVVGDVASQEARMQGPRF